MPENNGGRPTTASRWRSGGLEETTLGRAPPSDRLLDGFGLLPFSDITIILACKSLPAIGVALLRSNNYAWRAPSLTTFPKSRVGWRGPSRRKPELRTKPNR